VILLEIIWNFYSLFNDQGSAVSISADVATKPKQQPKWIQLHSLTKAIRT